MNMNMHTLHSDVNENGVSIRRAQRITSDFSQKLFSFNDDGDDDVDDGLGTRERGGRALNSRRSRIRADDCFV